MDLAETLFGMAWRWAKARRAGAATGLPVEVHDRRLLAIAGMLAERPVLLRHAEAAGGVRGRVLLLPTAIDLGDPLLDAEVLLLRVVWGGAHIARTAAIDAEPGANDEAAADLVPNDGPLGQLRHLHAMATTRAQLVEAFPTLQARLCDVGGRVEDALAAAEGGGKQGLSPQQALLAAERGRLHRGEALTPWQAMLPVLAAASPRGAAMRASPLVGAALGAAEADAADALMASQKDLRATLPHGTERRARPRDAVRRVMLETEETPPLPVHVFEKIDTLDSFAGGKRKVDGSDELEAHADALDEVDLRAIVRGGADVASILKLDLHGLDIAPEVADGAELAGVPLPEWDDGRRAYRDDWVRVMPRRCETSDAAWAQGARARLGRQIRDLERRIGSDRSRRRIVGRQPDGQDIDLDALVEERAAAEVGMGRFDRVDLQERRQLRDVATLVLLDISLSADAWVEGGAGSEGHRVLDLTRDAAFVVAEVAWRLGDRVGLLGFASETRHRCEMLEILGFDERWPAAAGRLGALRPRGYTRIGPALRWGKRLLERSGARHQVLLLVTDGKPTDYDRYEGRYGVADVRQAVREAEQAGIDVHALCLDRGAAATMPAMVGAGRYELLRHPSELPMRLAGAWRRHGA